MLISKAYTASLAHNIRQQRFNGAEHIETRLDKKLSFLTQAGDQNEIIGAKRCKAFSETNCKNKYVQVKQWEMEW